MPDTLNTLTAASPTAMTSSCSCCTTLERVRYFPRQLLCADDMRAEQQYFRERLKRHNLNLHGWGVVCGCNVVASPTATQPWLVQVCPGYVVGPQGDEISICDAISFDLQLGTQNQDPCAVSWPCPPQPVAGANNQQQIGYLAIRYTECTSRPVRVHPAGCGCDELACEYSRLRDSFELKLLWSLPASHTQALNWQTGLHDLALKNRETIGRLTPPCLPCAEDPWVVLATITIPAAPAGSVVNASKTPITADNISAADRRVLLSTAAIQAITGL